MIFSFLPVIHLFIFFKCVNSCVSFCVFFFLSGLCLWFVTDLLSFSRVSSIRYAYRLCNLDSLNNNSIGHQHSLLYAGVSKIFSYILTISYTVQNCFLRKIQVSKLTKKYAFGNTSQTVETEFLVVTSSMDFSK